MKRQQIIITEIQIFFCPKIQLYKNFQKVNKVNCDKIDDFWRKNSNIIKLKDDFRREKFKYLEFENIKKVDNFWRENSNSRNS